jgi:alpha-beta hydrolase superfamily lysophospholipase
VLLHGLTDAPYSLRHIARLYRARGWLALGLRLPGHGTVPAGLTTTTVEDWTAATRMAVRTARARLGPDRPLHLVGFSNGGALALHYALAALEDPALAPPDRLVLLTPMVGITEFARFAGIAGWPALLPAFAEAAWLVVSPEFNPFKYNSFPVNGAVQSHRLTRILQSELRRLAARGRLADLPPVLTLQSAVDFTVSARAIVEGLYGLLPEGGHELVLIDVNRAGKLGPLLNPAARRALDRLLPPPPRSWRSIVVTSAGPDDPRAIARIAEPGPRRSSCGRSRSLGRASCIR